MTKYEYEYEIIVFLTTPEIEFTILSDHLNQGWEILRSDVVDKSIIYILKREIQKPVSEEEIVKSEKTFLDTNNTKLNNEK